MCLRTVGIILILLLLRAHLILHTYCALYVLYIFWNENIFFRVWVSAMNSVCDNVRYVIFTETEYDQVEMERYPLSTRVPNTQSTHSSNALAHAHARTHAHTKQIRKQGRLQLGCVDSTSRKAAKASFCVENAQLKSIYIIVCCAVCVSVSV